MNTLELCFVVQIPFWVSSGISFYCFFMLNFLIVIMRIIFCFMFVSLNQSILTVMTSKEFRRKLEYYSVLFPQVSEFYIIPFPDEFNIYRVSVLGFEVDRKVVFIPTLEDLSYVFNSVDFPIELVVIDFYDNFKFSVDLKNFKSFVSKCSEYQLEVLRSDSRFINILNFISNG